ncbi:hypothetical protein SBY92_004001 [Candida maltosa Xu316]
MIIYKRVSKEDESKNTTSTSTLSHNPTHGTFTPITQTHSHEFTMTYNNHHIDMDSITEEKFTEKSKNINSFTHEEGYKECPCGHLHGPGQGANHDIHAVGLSDHPLLRGPD